MPRKHLISDGIKKKQQLQSKIWQKLAREIKAAVKVGGANVDGNPRLKIAIDKALDNNLSWESINKNINGGNKEGLEMKQFEYECYGPNGIQIIVTALAENENRVVSNLRGYLSKLHGEIAKANSVKIFFENFGIIVLQKINTFQTKDDIEEIIINNNLEGYIETKEYEDSFEVFTEPNNSFYKIRDELIKNSFKVFESSIKLVSSSKVTNVDEDTKQRMQRFIESCENDDDIQSVITNYEEE